MEKASRTGIVGDGDPLDICVLAEKTITHGDILLPVMPIGGLRMIDDNEADDKIIAVMRTDAIYGHLRDIYECPAPMIERLKHYFLTYKDAPGKHKRETEITHVYGRDEAQEVIERTMADYDEEYGRAQGAVRVAAHALSRGCAAAAGGVGSGEGGRPWPIAPSSPATPSWSSA